MNMKVPSTKVPTPQQVVDDRFCDDGDRMILCTPEGEPSGFRIDNDRVVFKKNELDHADAATFQAITKAYGYDSNSIFYKDRGIEMKSSENIRAINEHTLTTPEGIFFTGKKISNTSLSNNVTGYDKTIFHATDGDILYSFSAEGTTVTPLQDRFEIADSNFTLNGEVLYCNGNALSKVDDGFEFSGLYRAKSTDAYYSIYIDPRKDYDPHHPESCRMRVAGKIEAIDETYTRDGNFVRWKHMPIMYADPQTFTPINDTYSVDSTQVFMRDSRIDDADPSTFVPIDVTYSKDGKNVFRNGERVWDADPESFTPFQQHGYIYSRDKDYVYHKGQRILGVSDPQDFIVENDDLAYEGESVFFYGSKIEGVDSDTYLRTGLNTIKSGKDALKQAITKDYPILLQEGSCNDQYSKGGNTIYFRSYWIGYTKGDFYCLGRGYAKDKEKVYFGGVALKGADPNSFTLLQNNDHRLGNFYAKDANALYKGRKRTIVTDPDSFEILDHVFQRDDSHIYYYGEPIINSDPKLFDIKPTEDSEDENYIYKNGIAIAKEKKPLPIIWYKEQKDFISDELPFVLFSRADVHHARPEFNRCFVVGRVADSSKNYKNWDLITCIREIATYGGGVLAVPYRILSDGNTHKIIYEDSVQLEGDFGTGYYEKIILSQFAVGDVFMPELELPEKITIPTEDGEIELYKIRFGTFTGGLRAQFEPKKAVYTHQAIGDIFVGTGEESPAGFFAFTRDGFPVRYGVIYENTLPFNKYGLFSVEGKETEYKFSLAYHCESGESHIRIPPNVVDANHLKPFTITKNGDTIHQLADSKNALYSYTEKYYSRLVHGDYNPKGGANEDPTPPWSGDEPTMLFWQDPLGNWLLLMDSVYYTC
jgi:hypothetical protein